VDESRSELTIEGDFVSASGPEALAPREAEVYRGILGYNAMLAETYRRAISLTRGLGPVDRLAPVLGLHLCRELMNALPNVIDKGGGLARVEYRSEFNQVVAAWPPDPDGTRTGEVPEAARAILLDLLAQHEASETRAGAYARMVKRLDPSSWKVPTVTADKQWAAIHERALAVAHHLMRVPRVGWPSITEARQTVDELTDVLFVMLAPHYVTTDALDELLARTAPTVDDARQVARLLGLHQQATHFFSRAEPAWLDPLIAHGGFFDPGPAYVPADEPGYIRYPPWPQGEFLLRATADSPGVVLAQLLPHGRVPKPRLSENPYVVRTVVEILLAAPIALVARHLAKPVGWPEHSRVNTITAKGLTQLALRLIEAGEAARGYAIAAQVVRALDATERSGMADYLLGQCLAILVDGVEALGDPDRSARLAKFLIDELRRLAQPKYEFSTTWLPSFENRDHDEHLWHDRPWRLLLAANRAAQSLPAEPLAALVERLLRQPRESMKRLGLALVAKRHEDLMPIANKIVSDAETWEGGATDVEFRDVVRASFGDLRPAARSALVTYALAARRIRRRHRQARRRGVDEPAAEWVSGWRSVLLASVSDQLTASERRRLGTLTPVSDEPRRGVHRIEPVRPPLSAAELTSRPVADVVEFLNTWVPSGGVFGADKPTLAVELRTAVLSDPVLWGARIAEMGEIGLVYSTQVLRGFEEVEQNREEPVDWAKVLSWIRSCLDAPPAEDEWRLEAERASASAIERVARKRALDGGEGAAATRLLVPLLRSPDPDPEQAARGPTVADVLMLSLKSVRGEAITAGTWLLHRLLEDETDDAGTAAELGDELAAVLARERTALVAVSFGRGLPLLLEADEKKRDHRWRDLLLTEADESFCSAVWQGYLLTWTRPIRAIIDAAADFYRSSTEAIESLDVERREPLSVVEQLGHHLALLHLWASIPDAEALLRRFFELARDEDRSTIARFIADHLAVEGQSEAAIDRAISFLTSRVASTGEREGEALLWASRSRYRRDGILFDIVLPAIDAGHGEADFGDVLRLMVEFAAKRPGPVATALQGLMQRDRWHSIPVIAAEDLATILGILLASGDENAQRGATKIINDLGALGYHTYRTLLS
jgi:hypothetical protein